MDFNTKMVVHDLDDLGGLGVPPWLRKPPYATEPLLYTTPFCSTVVSPMLIRNDWLVVGMSWDSPHVLAIFTVNHPLAKLINRLCKMWLTHMWLDHSKIGPPNCGSTIPNWDLQYMKVGNFWVQKILCHRECQLRINEPWWFPPQKKWIN
jgi:hypothetical protein